MTEPTGSLSEAAIRGSAWTTAQTVINKFAVLIASLVLARLLDPADYGIAFIATTVGAFFFVLAPWVLNDLLVSDPRGFERNAGTALLAGVGTALVLGLLMIASIPLLRLFEPRYAGFGLLLAVVALRPLADAWMAVPWAALRIRLQYARIAIIDGSMQLAGTAAAVLMAVQGAGPMTLVLPPSMVLFAQGSAYWFVARGTVPLKPQRTLFIPIYRRFTVAAASQYLNNVVKVLELLVLAWLATPAAVGLFAFAFQLSSQANVVIANQTAGVIQPILSHINDQPKRQYQAFLRALRLIGCVGVPLSVVQGAAGFPVFRIFFGAKWDGAVAIFLVLSFMQAFIFVATPIMVMLKAQGRFRLIFAWQLSHVLVGACLIVAMVKLGTGFFALLPVLVDLPTTGDTALPLAASIAGTFMWGIGCPYALHAAGQPAGASWRSVLAALVQPWPAALGGGLLVGMAPHILKPITGDLYANIATIVLAAPIALAAIALAAASNIDSRRELKQFARALNRRFRLVRNGTSVR